MLRRNLAPRAWAFGLVLGLAAGALPAAVGISPAYVEVSLDKGRPAGRFLISNLGEQEERYRIKAIHFTYTPQGALSQAPTGKYSLAEWIVFNPTELTIAPKTQRAVRFAIVPKGALEKDGEYWGAMELESLEAREVVREDPSGKSVRLKMIATIMVPIFATTGQARYGGQVKEVAIVPGPEGPVLEVLVANTGTGRLGAKGTYEILDASGKTVEKGEVGSAYVLREGERKFAKPLQGNLPEGRYSIKVQYAAAHLDKPLQREVQVDWKPPPQSGSTQPATRAATSSAPATRPRE